MRTYRAHLAEMLLFPKRYVLIFLLISEFCEFLHETCVDGGVLEKALERRSNHGNLEMQQLRQYD